MGKPSRKAPATPPKEKVAPKAIFKGFAKGPRPGTTRVFTSPQRSVQAPTLFETTHQKTTEYGKEGDLTGNQFVKLFFNAKFNKKFAEEVLKCVKTLREKPYWQPEMCCTMLRVHHLEHVPQVLEAYNNTTGLDTEEIATGDWQPGRGTVDVNIIKEMEVKLENDAVATKQVCAVSCSRNWQVSPLLESMGFKYNKELQSMTKFYDVGEDATFNDEHFEAGGYDVSVNTFDSAEQP